ncbi:hypothetical protein KL914_003068 [Ogataea haglerorum]|nr:hypothetical protein KL914_003068 [Ogataea haglerorum]
MMDNAEDAEKNSSQKVPVILFYLLMHTTVPPVEKAVYDELTAIRQRLSLIKRDHKTYMNSKSIGEIYDQVLSKVEQLRAIRSTEGAAEGEYPNKVDILVDEIFQLLSLCFVTCGLKNTAPATYASLSTVQRLLEHLNENEIYTHQDLDPIRDRLDEIAKIVNSDETTSSEELSLLKSKLEQSYKEYRVLEDKINKLPKNVQRIMDRLITLKYRILEVITSDDAANRDDLKVFSNQLEQIQLACELEFSKEEHPKGEGVLKGLIDDCHYLIQDMKIGEDMVSPELADIYNQLEKLKSTLENLLVTRRWVLRTTDIFNYQRTLNQIDKLRVDGYFGKKELRGQAVLLYLLRRCYAIIYKLLESSEPVSESLQPLHNQLTTVRRCLLDLKRMGGISSIRELYPYQMKLASVDNLREDGKFMIDGQIPEGQGTLNALLAECFDIVHELKIEFYEKDETERKDDETKFQANVIGTKAQETNYDYNIMEPDSNEEDNLAVFNESIGESETDGDL